ncbi:hypothetical protein [Draconibacterium mangrovi]|uniref:hypothetical protein n=1 Tax=Draconibacterium mangrovi TaxID=2697469 RepID=UPI0013D50674|nr:hypothetical protein [Draconibacterium mangrovi]
MSKNIILKIRVTKFEFKVIEEVSISNPGLYEFEKINEHEYIIKFANIENAEELDELVKDQLVYKGFDINYNPNSFGLAC